jgi:fatty acid desaturase
MLPRTNPVPSFSIGEARSLVQDLFTPKPLVYWADYLLSISVGLGCLSALRRLPLGSPWVYVAWFVGMFAFYRAVLFTHEIAHFRKGTFRGFRFFWNLTCGVPFLIPTFTYQTHLSHHARRHYGTREDGEYLPIGAGALGGLAVLLLSPFVMPLIAIVRFGLLTPLSWFSPKIRDAIHRHASSMVIDPMYLRPLPTLTERREWRLQEAACAIFLWVSAALWAFGPIDTYYIVRIYCLSVGVLTLNAIRTLGAHRYRNAGEEMTFTEQLLDSINFPRRPWLTEIWAPVGLRFHALHHLFPSMPYHNLSKAHHRLMAQLPADSPYRQTVCDSLFAAIYQLLRDARAAQRYNERVRMIDEKRAAHYDRAA